MKKRVSIDLELAMSPFAMASVLSALRAGRIASVHVPATLQLIEVGLDGIMPDTLRLLDEKPKGIEDFARLYGYAPDNVKPHDPIAGLYLLSRAWQDGLITELETESQSRWVASQFGEGRSFPDFYRRMNASGREVRINPDSAGRTLEGLIGRSIEDGIAPIFGDQEFLFYFAQRAEDLKLGRLIDHPPNEPNITKLKDLPVKVSMEALYKFSSDAGFASLLPHLSVPVSLHTSDGEAIEILTELGAVVVDHATHSVWAGMGRVAYKLWRATLAR